jgi:O-antigen/teichoic acid export membrane protein
LLYAWQRIDICNYSGIAQLVIGLGVLWIGFYLGLGVFSLLAGFMAGWLGGTAICFFACLHLGFWPKTGEWGHASRAQFRELFNYGADIFLISIGTQLIMSSQTVLVSRQLGMEAAALWSVMTKAFTVISQIVFRVVGNAMPAFAEMHVRKENDRMWSRYRAMFITVSVLAGYCGVLFAACNGPFVTVWMHGQFSWPAINNALLAAWLVVMIEQCCHNSLIMFLKEIRGLKYVYLAEGVVFIGVSAAILPSTGLTGMLLCSLLATALLTGAMGTWRVSRLLGGRMKLLLWDWQLPLIRVLGVMVPCWLATEWMLRGAPDWSRLVINGSLLSVTGAWVSLRFALPPELVGEMIGKLSGPLQRTTAFLAGQSGGKKQSQT